MFEQLGREMLFTDVQEVTSENLIKIMRNVMPIHEANSTRMNFLIEYEAGKQDKIRAKKYRADIDNWCVDNIANEVTDFKTGYGWGNPITLVMRKNSDEIDKDISLAVTQLNEGFDEQNVRGKSQKLARFVEITGLGYSFIDINTEWEQEGDSYFTYNILDPRCTFIVYSGYYLDQRPMLAVTYYCDKAGNKKFTCFTRDSRYDLNSSYDMVHSETNPLGVIPITEWIRSHDRMGCFERQIDEMNNLNLLISDFTNDVDQNTQAIWHCNDVDFPTEVIVLEDGTEKEVVKKPKTNDWMQTFTTKEGKTPFVNALAVDYDYQGMLNNIVSRRALILQKCNVPSRNDNSGGSTGIAMDSATGWTQAEVEATRQDQLKDGSKMNEVKIALIAIKKNSVLPTDSPLRKLKHSDVKPKIARQKNYELSVKTTAFATMVSHGVFGLHALKMANLFDDTMQVWEDSKELIEMYQKSLFKADEQSQKEETTTTDGGLEAQIENSPLIDGMSKERPIE